MWLSSNLAEQGLKGIGETLLKSNMFASVFTDKTSELRLGWGATGGAGGIGGGCGGGLAANFKIEESIELLRFKENIGVVGTDVVDETDEATEPPCDDEFLKVTVLRFNYGSFLQILDFPRNLREIFTKESVFQSRFHVVVTLRNHLMSLLIRCRKVFITS